MTARGCIGTAGGAQNSCSRSCQGAQNGRARLPQRPQWLSKWLLAPASEPQKRSKLLVAPASEPQGRSGARKYCSKVPSLLTCFLNHFALRHFACNQMHSHAFMCSLLTNPLAKSDSEVFAALANLIRHPTENGMDLYGGKAKGM